MISINYGWHQKYKIRQENYKFTLSYVLKMYGIFACGFIHIFWNAHINKSLVHINVGIFNIFVIHPKFQEIILQRSPCMAQGIGSIYKFHLCIIA